MKRMISLLLTFCILLPMLPGIAFAVSDTSGITLESVVWDEEQTAITVTCPSTTNARTVLAAIYSGSQMYGSGILSSTNGTSYHGLVDHLPLSEGRSVTLKVFQLDAATYAPLYDTFSKNLSVTFDSAPAENEFPLIAGYSPFSSKFSPFFAATASDQDVAAMTQATLLTSDRTGAIILKGIEGETKDYNGTDYTYYGLSDLTITENADGTVYYDFVLRDDVKFADGHVMDIDDVIFSMYVLCDPTYDGSSTLYAQPILGMEAYRSGIDTRQNLILATERKGYTANDYFTEEQYNIYWAAFDRAGERFCQEIVEYCKAYGATDVKSAGALWGYPDLPADATTADWFAAIVDHFGYDLSDNGINYESAGTPVSSFIAEELGDKVDEYTAGVQTGDSAASIEGIQKTGDNSLRVVMQQLDATSIYQLAIPVAPMHYYGETSKYDFDNNSFGFTKGDLSHVRSVTAQPMGAGPYQFIKFKNGVVNFERNEDYYLGCPKIKYVHFQETQEADKLNGVVTGTLDITDPSFTTDVAEAIRQANGGELNGDEITTVPLDNLGYGYIGICADTVLVGDDPSSEASKNLRKAFATIFSVYRDVSIDSYYGDCAEVINYPISSTSWAAPQPNDKGYELAFSKSVNGNPIYTPGMIAQAKYAAALNAALGYFEAAGYTVANGKLVAAPEGAALEYELLIPGDGAGDHPVFMTVILASDALEAIGMNLIVTDLTNSSDLWTSLDAVQCDMWAAAWGAKVDPDMFQIYHSSNMVGLPGATGSNHFRINDPALDQLIMEARASTDQAFRKSVYKECLDIILDWAVEIPTYQRQNAVVFSTERVNIETITPDITTFYGWMAEIQNMEMRSPDDPMPDTPSGPDTPDTPTDPSYDPLSGIAYAKDTTFDYLYSSEITSMNYLATYNSQNQKALANFVDTLVEYDNHGNIVPCMAESWSVSDDGLTWTFKIREGVKWYTCEGEEYTELTAHDFVTAARLVADPKFDSDIPDVLIAYIENGLELYNWSDKNGEPDFTTLGVEALDDYTLVYHLRQPCAYFLTLLTYGCYLPINEAFYQSLVIENPEPVINDDGTEGDPITNEFGTDRDKILYCGGYLCSSWIPGYETIWVKNENYWDADNIFIEKVSGKYNAQADAIAPQLYLRGDIDECKVTTAILDDWMAGENADYVHTTMPTGFVQYMLLNFNQKHVDPVAGGYYDMAVNNKNFRKAIYHGIDYLYCLSAYDPYTPEAIAQSRLMSTGFCVTDGKDYNEFGPATAFNEIPFNEAKAKDYKAKAKAELEAQGCVFPIQIPLYYNPSTANMDQCCQLLEAQLESTLGTDFIEITVYAGPAVNYIAEVRRPGIWGLFEGGWGPDYQDPATFFEPFSFGWTYGSPEYIKGAQYRTGYIYTQEDYDNGVITDSDMIGTEQFTWYAMVEKARAETQDLERRYQLFAEAEAYALEEVLFIPFRQLNNGYVASNMTIFDGQLTQIGICQYKLKGRHMLEKSYNMDEYNTAKGIWERNEGETVDPDYPDNPDIPDTPDMPDTPETLYDPLSSIAYAQDTTYDYLYSSDITSMNYLATSASHNQKSLSNFVDTLVEYDCYGNLVPCLAESWRVSDDGLTWTFKIREDVKWYNCEGEECAELTAHDFVYAARLVADPNFGADLPDPLISYIVNGIELYNWSDKNGEPDFTTLGVEATNDYTLVYHLRQPCPYFLNQLTYNCYMPIYQYFYEHLNLSDGSNAFGTAHDNILYCGGYICSSWVPQDECVWVKNENYWDAENIFIEKVSGMYNAQADAIAPEMYLRGEIDECSVTNAILDDWMDGKNADFVHPTMPNGFVQYMLLNFDQHHEDEVAGSYYDMAVNNKNFRKAIYHGIDRQYCLSAYDRHDPQTIIQTRMMPDGFCFADGKDYNAHGEDAQVFNENPFDEDIARDYAATAKTELEAQGCVFPIQIPLYYNPSTANMDQCCQLLEAQLESTLGRDFVNITIYAGPSTNYIAEVRRPGIWGLFEGGWGPDYQDPATFFEPFSYGWTYGRQEYIKGDQYKTGYIYTQEDYNNSVITDEDMIGQPQYVFNFLVETARAETQDLTRRYELFAEAEAYALEEVLLIPFRQLNNGYVASNISIFDGPQAMTGICQYKLKGRHMLEKSYSMDEYAAAKAIWSRKDGTLIRPDTATILGTAAAEYAYNSNIGSNYGILYNSEKYASITSASSFRTHAEELGLNLVAEVTFPNDSTTDFTTQLNACKAAGVDALFMPINEDPTDWILMQAKNMGYCPAFFNCDGMLELPADPIPPSISAETATAEEIINAIYAYVKPPFDLMTMPVNLNDAEETAWFTGVTNPDLLKDAAISEAMMGSLAYSLVVVRAQDASDAVEIADMIQENLDPDKWIFERADDFATSIYQDLVMFVMLESRFVIPAENFAKAFQTVLTGAPYAP